jgi:hypothetical protein
MHPEEEGQMGQHSISVLAFQEGDKWSAQCLQYDISAQADTLSDLPSAFERALVGHIIVSKQLGLEPLEGLGSAPQIFWDLFDKANVELKPKKRPPFRLPSGVRDTPRPDLWVSSTSSQLAFA